jgi:hypothetical protein
MANTLVLDPNTIYDEGAVSLALDISLATLDRARREGQLRYTRKGRRIFFRGQWFLDWFEADRAGSGVRPHSTASTPRTTRRSPSGGRSVARSSISTEVQQ